MGIVETANRLAIQYACIAPLWSQQTAYAGAPASPGSGVSMGGSPAYLLAIDLREDVARRTMRISVSTLSDTDDYTVELASYDVTYTASSGDTQQAILSGLKALIEADTNLNALVNCTVTGTGTEALLTLTGKAEADYALTDLSTGGVGALTCIADPTSLSFRVYASMVVGDAAAIASKYASRYRLVNGAGGTLDYRGMVDQPLCGGVSYIYVELYDVDGAGDSAGTGGTITYSPMVLMAPGQV